MLGHVQSGNIFVDVSSDTCRLGGFENTLLGYKTRLYRLCRNHLQHFDVIMFGMIVAHHVVVVSSPGSPFG